MKVLIRKGYFLSSSVFNRRNEKWQNIMDQIAGTWQEVDTSTLFANQYNLTCGVRVFDEHVLAVADDERVGKMKCPYCGSVIDKGQECTKHAECADYTPRSLESLVTKYNGQMVPFQHLEMPESGEIELVRNSYCYLRPIADTPFYRLSGSTYNVELAFVGGDIYALSIGYNLVKTGGRDTFPYIAKYAVEALKKEMRKQGLSC